MSTRPQAGCPRKPDQVAVVRVVIGVLVRDEDVPQRRERHAGKGQLAGDPVAAIDHVRGVAADNHLRGCRARLPRTRAAARSEEDEPVARF